MINARGLGPAMLAVISQDELRVNRCNLTGKLDFALANILQVTFVLTPCELPRMIVWIFLEDENRAESF